MIYIFSVQGIGIKLVSSFKIWNRNKIMPSHHQNNKKRKKTWR